MERLDNLSDVFKMLNINQHKLVELINQFIISRYMQNIYLMKSKVIKLYSAMPYTGAPNISDPQTIAIIQELDKFVACNYTSSNN